MKLHVVDAAIDLCLDHLNQTGKEGSKIDLMLANYLAVLIHSEFEREIERMIEERASKVSDPVLRDLIISCVGAVFRSTKISEIAGLLNRFGVQFKNYFHAELIKFPRASPSWDSIVSHRH